MSAPWEVWVQHGHAHPDVSLLPKALQESIRLYGVRYLRADLTCRNCALFPYPKKCSHASIVDGDVFTPIASSPACMSFAPKEER